ncbi:MAG: glycosyltransferase family A protein [Dehalococcoidia bacterium]
MSRTTPPLTVVIATHNRVPLLAQAIESVLASPLVQSPAAVIVVDDASSDDTPAVAQRYGVRYERVSVGGPSGTRNAGLKLVETEFVAFLDDDDLWLPGNMAPQLDALRRHPAAAYAYGRVQLADLEGVPFGVPFPYPPLRSGRAASYILMRPPQLGVVLFRRRMIGEEGGFDTELRYGEDGDLLVRLAAKYPIMGVDHVGLCFRQRDSSIAEADARWRAHLDFARASRKWRRLGIQFPRLVLLKANAEYRGRASFYMCRDAQWAINHGQRTEARRLLGYALRISPIHTLLRHRPFWATFRTLL